MENPEKTERTMADSLTEGAPSQRIDVVIRCTPGPEGGMKMGLFGMEIAGEEYRALELPECMALLMNFLGTKVEQWSHVEMEAARGPKVLRPGE